MICARLDQAVRAVCPILGVSVSSGTPPSVIVSYATEATLEQKRQAQATIAAFDWSDQADAAWLLARNAKRKAIYDASAKAFADNAAFRASKNPGTNQIRDYLTQVSTQMDLVIARLMDIT